VDFLRREPKIARNIGPFVLLDLGRVVHDQSVEVIGDAIAYRVVLACFLTEVGL